MKRGDFVKIHIRNNKPCIVERDILVAKSVKIYTANFIFDAEWDGFTITAVFESGGTRYEQPLLDGTSCIIPWEVLEDPGHLYISVYGVKDDQRRVSTVTESIPIRAGAEPGGEFSKDPTPDQYEQIMAAIAAGKLKGDPGKSAYEYAVEGGYTGTEQEFAAEIAAFYTTVASARQEIYNSGAAQVQAVETAGSENLSSINTAGQTQVNTVNSAGDAQINAVHDAGAAQVETVTDAGAAQKQVIEDAGAQALANIGTGIDATLTLEGKAADAKAAGEKIDELKDNIMQLNAGFACMDLYTSDGEVLSDNNGNTLEATINLDTNAHALVEDAKAELRKEILDAIQGVITYMTGAI